jgi:beta-mannanase
MKKKLLTASKRIVLVFLLIVSFNNSPAQQLKSIVYDFDGLDVNQTGLPEGDYSVLDLSYRIATNPLTASDMLGDRVLKLNLNWNASYGAFGRGISRFIEFDPNTDKFNFYFYNPVSNNQSAILDVVITDDDNQNNTYESNSDDTWKKSFSIPGSSDWQLFSAPLNSFTDINAGGNGVFDMAFTQNKGMLLMVEFRFSKPAAGVSNPTFYLDMINFSDGNMPTGATIFDLPPKNANDHCLLGAYQYNPRGQEYKIPSEVESLFPVVPGKKLKYANYFLDWAYDGTTVAKELPGNEVQTLISNGYRPIITWEPMFWGYDRLDSRQPRLSNIINGDYNSYIDLFADKIKTYTDTVIIRFMHEFEGNWYSWSLAHNGQDPARYASAFRKVVDRFRARGVTNVKWMWCVNSDYFPYLSYNWIVPAYPGDNYVDIIATDIYNNHYPPEMPWWRSFRWQMTESYYYLTKYFPSKPLYMCELGCRERYGSEDPTSESKGSWFARMDKELQSDYHKTRAMIFFNSAPDQNWFLNSSASALQSLTDNIWYDDYYFGLASNANSLAVSITSPANNSTFLAGSSVTINATALGGTGTFQKIEFYSGTTKLGEDLTSPYNFIWNSVPAGSYQLTAKVYDSGGSNAISPVVNISMEVLCSGYGSITHEVWNGVSGTTVSTIPVNSAPSSTSAINSFQTPENAGDNYGQRVRGYICPPVTGSYIFWIASDDNSELWLSTNDLQANKQKIAYVNGWTFASEWTKYPTQQSAAINLTAGQKYYIEALHKEGGQGDHLAVGWQLPNSSQERPIPGIRLSPYSIPLSINITSPSNNSLFSAGSNILIQAEAFGGTNVFQKVEFFIGTIKLGEDLTAPYTFTWSNVSSGNYQLTARVTDNTSSSAVSSVINITVGGSCTATGLISREVWTNVSGSTVASIPLSTSPSSIGMLSVFEAPQNVADNYGQRISGYVCAPLTGNYTFWIASDDNSELWLSSNQLPGNKQKIASVPGYTASRDWTKYPAQQSVQVALVAGQKYYIEALHKEGIQGDNLAVGWQLPNGTLERPIPGSRLSEYNVSPSTTTVIELIPAGASWKYLDNGTNQGTAWRNTSFDDGIWQTGNAELGYGDGGEATVIGYGASSTNKYITSYFRKTFNVSSITGLTKLELSVVRDDGIVVYLNGSEVHRNNMPSGSISYNTLALNAINGNAESNYNIYSISSSSLVAGNNVIAVEIHQQSSKSSDVSFNLRLKATYTSQRNYSEDSPCEINIQPANSTTFCEGGQVILKTNEISGYKYQWIKNEQDIEAATAAEYTAVDEGNYQVKVFSDECVAWSAPVQVTINKSLTARITAGNSTSFCNGKNVMLYANSCEGYLYQWKKDGVDIPGATGNRYLAKTSGDYQVKIIDGSSIAWSALMKVTADPCDDESGVSKDQVNSISEDSLKNNDHFKVNVYPNPTTGSFTFDFCLEDAKEETLQVHVINSTGQIVYEQAPVKQTGCIKKIIELNEQLPAGAYILQIRMGTRVENTKVLLNK